MAFFQSVEPVLALGQHRERAATPSTERARTIHSDHPLLSLLLLAIATWQSAPAYAGELVVGSS